MVHALHQARNLLKPGGLLVNIHDLPIPHVLAVHSAGTTSRAGWLLDQVDFENERSALNALAQLVSEGSFLLEDEQDFVFDVYVDDLPELQKWLADSWESAYLSDSTIQRIVGLYQQAAQKARIVLKVPTRMTKLRVI
ncbi:MAG TPA: hypothetical protein VLA49_02410 [Anaerolineales bacterium]|nr:hypothetical protein [Anaerolineales bacterium]